MHICMQIYLRICLFITKGELEQLHQHPLNETVNCVGE